MKKNPEGYEMTRRGFLLLSSMSAAGLVAGCATNPVTGKSQLMLVSESTEISVDRKNSPHQFSSDYGALQDGALNRYINRTGRKLAAVSHRPGMPYSFRGVNATYINAYAFPGGSIAVTRGILLSLENEAELAALLGHELGHVNARHTARQMSKGLLTQALVGGVTAYAGAKGSGYGKVAQTLGMLGAGALLASYSRDNEREADGLGLEYMVKAGYNPKGMTGLMDMLRTMSKHKPNALELMFSTHPMSDERYRNTKETIGSKYPAARNKSVFRDRYMDNTAGLRSIKGAIEEMQKGEKEMARSKYQAAEGHFKKALRIAPNDYAGLLMMSKCQLAMKRDSKARRFAERARKIYPREAQACHLNGFLNIRQKRYETAYNEFNRYEQLLPGNPGTTFFKGLALEKMKNRRGAAREYSDYLQVVQKGDKATYAYGRLVEWGYIKQEKKKR